MERFDIFGCNESARNESIDHMLRSAGIISHAIAKSWELSKWIQQRSVMVCADEERTDCRAKGQGTVPVYDAPVGQLLHRHQAATPMTA